MNSVKEVLFVITVTLLGAIVLNIVLDQVGKARVAKSACRNCGRPFGKAAVKNARKKFWADLHSARRAHPGYRICAGRYWTLVCENCGSTARYHYLDRWLETGPFLTQQTKAED